MSQTPPRIDSVSSTPALPSLQDTARRLWGVVPPGQRKDFFSAFFPLDDIEAASLASDETWATMLLVARAHYSTVDILHRLARALLLDAEVCVRLPVSAFTGAHAMAESLKLKLLLDQLKTLEPAVGKDLVRRPLGIHDPAVAPTVLSQIAFFYQLRHVAFGSTFSAFLHYFGVDWAPIAGSLVPADMQEFSEKHPMAEKLTWLGKSGMEGVLGCLLSRTWAQESDMSDLFPETINLLPAVSHFLVTARVEPMVLGDTVHALCYFWDSRFGATPKESDRMVITAVFKALRSDPYVAFLVKAGFAPDGLSFTTFLVNPLLAAYEAAPANKAPCVALADAIAKLKLEWARLVSAAREKGRTTGAIAGVSSSASPGYDRAAPAAPSSGRSSRRDDCVRGREDRSRSRSRSRSRDRDRYQSGRRGGRRDVDSDDDSADEIICWTCNRPGHRQAGCPRRAPKKKQQHRRSQ